MRTKKTFKNMITSVLANIFTIIIGFFSRYIFIIILGNEYNGLNGLFTNIISLLSIVELGIGNAIIYNLYKPIAQNDTKTIQSLMNYYKKSYHVIGLIVAIIGIILIPFLDNLVGDITINVNIVLVYILFLSDAVFSYFLSYKRSILYANQENYYISICNIFYQIFMNLFQIIILYYTKNFYLFLIIKNIFRIIENIIITIIANKKYPYLKNNNSKELDKKIKSDIVTKIKALFFHQIGGFVVNGTDNIIISLFFGIINVGLYSNYYLIINSIQTISKQIIQASIPSIGNLLVTESNEKQFSIFRKIRFINYWITTVCSICILLLMKPFIIIWIGESNLLSQLTLIILVFNFYQNTSRFTYISFKNAAGIFFEDRFIPILESLTNILFSIIFLKIFGMPGVFIGTFISSMWLWCYSYPKFVYKGIFKKSYYNYIKETLSDFIIFIFIAVLCMIISNIIQIENQYTNLILNFIISFFIPNITLCIIFNNNNEFKYFLRLIKRKGVLK